MYHSYYSLAFAFVLFFVDIMSVLFLLSIKYYLFIIILITTHPALKIVVPPNPIFITTSLTNTRETFHLVHTVHILLMICAIKSTVTVPCFIIGRLVTILVHTGRHRTISMPSITTSPALHITIPNNTILSGTTRTNTRIIFFFPLIPM